MMHDYDSGLSFVSTESVLQPDNLAMAYLTFIPLWSSRADYNQHSIVNLGYSTKLESVLEDQVTSGPVVVVSTCSEDVLAAQSSQPSLGFTVLTQETIVREIPCDHDSVGVQIVDLASGLLEY